MTMLICFDVDGTLIDENDMPRTDVIEMLKTLAKKHKIIVWTGGGKDYAEMWVKRLFIQEYVAECRVKPHATGSSDINFEIPDIAFDDEVVYLAKTNVVI